MKTSEQLIVRRVVFHFLCAAGLPTAIAIVAMAGDAVDVFYETNIRTLLETITHRRAMVAALVFTASFFSLAQVSRLPQFSSIVSKWLMSTGWDGSRSIYGLSLRLHWTELCVITGLLLLESMANGGPSVYSLLCWFAVRSISLRGTLRDYGEGRAVGTATLFWILLLAILEWPALVIIAVALLTVQMEMAHGRAIRRWAAHAMAADLELLPKLTANKPMARKLFPWHQLSFDFANPQASFSQRLCVAGAVTLWSTVTMWCFPEMFANYFRLEVKSTEEVLWHLPGWIALIPVVVLGMQQLSRCSFAQWNSVPGILGRILLKRPIVWKYDVAWVPFVLSLLAIPLSLAGVRAIGLPLPAQSALTSCIATGLVLFLSPDAEVWQLTAPATLKRPMEIESMK